MNLTHNAEKVEGNNQPDLLISSQTNLLALNASIEKRPRWKLERILLLWQKKFANLRKRPENLPRESRTL